MGLLLDSASGERCQCGLAFLRQSSLMLEGCYPSCLSCFLSMMVLEQAFLKTPKQG